MPKQIEVTRVAMVSRLRRRLAKDGLILRMNRPRTRCLPQDRRVQHHRPKPQCPGRRRQRREIRRTVSRDRRLGVR